MQEDNRPNPEDLLKLAQAEEEENNASESKRGNLKIFLGFCAGVGKTYRMLQEAAHLKESGIDVVIGIVETHGRVETQELTEKLETIPRKKIMYHELALEEMDLDKILELKPQLVLVDELAHTNVPTSRHDKRYQDVEELLNSGIDVYTTINIQHTESLIDIIYQISHIKVDETVPDRILQLADEIELVDLPPEKLLERLKEGKVYVPDKAKQAMQRFFKKGNLLALRELSLRYTAKRVDKDMLLYKEAHAILTPWEVGSRLMVGISTSPSSEKLLRITHRMAEDMSAEWFAVYVDSPQQVEINEQARHQLDKNIKLAEELGAKIVFLSGNVIADEIIRFARQKNITLILAGLSHRSRFEEIFKGSVLNELVRKSGEIHVLIVGNKEQKDFVSSKTLIKEVHDYKPYFLSLCYITLTIILGWFVRAHIEPVNIGMLLLIPVVISGILWGTRIGIFASFISVAAFDFFFIPPYNTFRITDLKYIPSFIVFIAVAVITSILAKLIRRQAENSRNRERFITALYNFSKEIMPAKTLEDISEKAVNYISDAFESDIVILIPGNEGKLEVKAEKTDYKNTVFEEKDLAVANWVYKNAQPAGKGTKTLSSEQWHFIPLKTKETTLGVVSIRFESLTPEQNHLLESFINIFALAVFKTS